MKKVLIIFAVCICMCGNAFAFELLDNINKAGEIGTEVEQLKKENELLKKEVEDIKDRLKIIEAQTAFQGRRLNIIYQVFPDQAIFQPSEMGYSVITCKTGYFAISCENIKPYATGSEITLQVVNMLSINATNVVMNISYAAAMFDINNQDETTKYFKTRKERQEKIGDCTSARAKLVKVRIPEYKPDELKCVEISMSVGGIEFIKPNNK